MKRAGLHQGGALRARNRIRQATSLAALHRARPDDPGRRPAITRNGGSRLKRTSGSHHILARPDISELLSLQEVRGQAKPYQIRQFLRLVQRYDLTMEDER